jgi:hypothetical protein
MWTGLVKGQTWSEARAKLEAEHISTALGFSAFWLPMMFLNFRFVPVAVQTYVVSSQNAVCMAGLSYFSNGGTKPRATVELALPDIPENAKDLVTKIPEAVMTPEEMAALHAFSATVVESVCSC